MLDMTGPVAQVAVDMPLAHLDRPFDYRIEPDQLDRAVPGVRVKVRFAGRIRSGFILSVSDTSPRPGLLPLREVVSAEPVLTSQIAELARRVAVHYAGGFADVVRLAVPPRHAATERAVPPQYPEPVLNPGGGPLSEYYRLGAEFIAGVRNGAPPRAAWGVLPAAAPAGDWMAGFLEAAQAALAAGRGALLLVPDGEELAELQRRAGERFGAGSFVVLSAAAGPAARYRAFLAVLRGQVKLVLGSRSAVFAPVRDLGLIALWDDGDDTWAESRAPYPHSREIVALRAHTERSALILAAHARTAEVQALVRSGWLANISLPADQVRAGAALVRVAAADDRALERDPAARVARVPHDAFEVLRHGLLTGPVLVSVPRAGYRPALACQRCGTRACCPRCGEGLADSGGQRVSCRWCGPVDWRCPHCQDRRLRAMVVGVQRTTEEFGKAFPGIRVLTSAADRRVSQVEAQPAIVLATPGAEPRAVDGYAAALVLDAASTLARPDLRAAEEALRRWLAVVGLVRPAADGGTVLVVGPSGERPVQALLRLDPIGFAERELAERSAAGFPPAVKLITIEGPTTAVQEANRQLELPGDAQRVGPFPLAQTDPVSAEPVSRLTLRCDLASAAELVAAVRVVLSVRAATKAPGALRVRVDPQQLD